MEEKKTVCTADIRSKASPLAKVLAAVILIVFVIGAIPKTTYKGLTLRLFFIEVYPGYYRLDGISIWAWVITVVLISFPIKLFLNSRLSKQCSLKLCEGSIDGQLKKTFTTAQLKLPLDKIDNIMVSETFFDRLRGGKTVSVRSTRGIIKFAWVQNADEFVQKALTLIEKDKASEGKSQSPTLSEADKISELKALMDKGLISQEEFEQKRRELLSRM